MILILISEKDSKILRVFKAHGIKATQIPIIVPIDFGFNIDDIDDRKSFQSKITTFGSTSKTGNEDL